MERTSETKPVTIVAIGAGNRTNKYLEYAIRNPDRMKLVGVAELNDIRRHAVASKFGLKPEECFADYERFFENPVPADAILIGTPENMHFEPCMKAIEAGYNVLLEKPIALPHRRSGAAQRGHRRRLPRPAIPSLFHQDQGDRRLGPAGRDHID